MTLYEMICQMIDDQHPGHTTTSWNVGPNRTALPDWASGNTALCVSIAFVDGMKATTDGMDVEMSLDNAPSLTVRAGDMEQSFPAHQIAEATQLIDVDPMAVA